ncbi:hypothetical protein [Chondrinema litorale]|uniref:hypothetical protein n=1 Tax=Chondrinema litorale TaxID=2994555 RepID=UPI002543880B|nr:hypothetical protein [Chondrinema litorale]UZR94897.1 hypothetical protein OQ292_03600 [Chondrinema litorale]
MSLLLLPACTFINKNESQIDVIINRYRYLNSFESDTNTYKIRYHNSIESHFFGSNELDGEEYFTDFFIEMDTTDKSQIIINGFEAYYDSYKKYLINNKPAFVSRYNYNLENPVDNIGLFFFYKNRLIYYNGGPIKCTYHYQDFDYNVPDLVKSDTSDFIRFYK